MREDAIQRNIQFPLLLYDEISKIAKTRGVSFASVVREACIQYLYTSTPGLCSHCHYQNQPEAKYCSSCGLPMTNDPEGFREYIKQTVKDVMEKMQNEKEEMRRG